MELLKVGDEAPELALLGSDGKEYSQKSFPGHKIVLYFYPKDDTPVCTQEACDFRDYLNVIEAKEAIVIGVSADDQSSHEKFISKYNLNYLLLSDPTKDMMKDYGVLKEGDKISRTTYILDEKRKVMKVYPKVKVQDHVEEILVDLN